jgi:hypothetical protein
LGTLEEIMMIFILNNCIVQSPSCKRYVAAQAIVDQARLSLLVFLYPLCPRIVHIG